MDGRRHQIEGGWVLIERDMDLFGHVLVYAVEGTGWEVARTGSGWRARLATHGKARRAFRGPGWESAPQCVRYMERYAIIRH